MASRGINYIIWKQRFYAPYDSKYGPASLKSNARPCGSNRKLWPRSRIYELINEEKLEPIQFPLLFYFQILR